MGGDEEWCGERHTVATATSQYWLAFEGLALFDEPIVWSETSPLRFHVQMSADTGGLPYTVKFFVTRLGVSFESAPATEVAPGIWEGTLGSGSPLAPGLGNLAGVEIVTPAPRAHLAVAVHGASWVDLPSPVGMKSVRQLLDEDTYRPAPTTFRTPERYFEFNDDAWTIRSFTGDLSSSPKTFAWTEDDPTAFVLVWTEQPGHAFVYDVLRDSSTDARVLTEYPVVTMRWADKVIQRNDAVGALSVSGPVSLEVKRSTPLNQSRPYTVYVLSVHGQRTLALMRWVMPNNHSANVNTPVDPRLVQVSASGASDNPLPATQEVTTFSLDVDWDSAAPLPARWTPTGCSTFPGDRCRVVYQGAFVWGVGVTTNAWVSAQDTRIEMTARLTYTPPPPEPDPAPPSA